LRESKRPRVNDAVSPSKFKAFEFVDEISHRATAIELKHERYIFEQQPSRIGRFKQLKHMPDESRLLSVYSCRLPCLTQVLAREPGGHHFRFGQAFQKLDIRFDLNLGKMVTKDCLSSAVDFAQRDGAETCFAQAKLDTAYASEQTYRRELTHCDAYCGR
jgi:hypothetical protein